MVCKYMTYKRHKEARIMCLLLRHFPFSNMAGYDLAQDKIIYLWDIQSTKWATEADKLEREENELVREAALAQLLY